LLSLLDNDVDVSDVYVDFKEPEPTEGEQEVCDTMQEILTRGNDLIAELSQYSDCKKLISTALSDPTEENEIEAFTATKENVLLVYRCYLLSKELVTGLANLLAQCKGEDGEGLKTNQASAKKVAEVFDFVLKFDEVKMRFPGIQNDFSFYRRMLHRHGDDSLVVNDQEANLVLLYIAQPSSMVSALDSGLQPLLKKGSNSKSIPTVLAIIANVCLYLVKSNGCPDDETKLLCLRSMVGSIILYDRISEKGAFVEDSGINIKKAITLLTKDFKEQKSLALSLKYSTIHLKDDTAPAAVQAMLEDY